jgi:RimJ/RimL family protein N-acetyltransferase
MPPVKITVPDRLSDGVVALRLLEEDDIAAYLGAFRDDPALGSRLGLETDPDEPSLRERVEGQAQPPEDTEVVQFAVADAATDAFCGEVMVHSLRAHHRRGEVGFWVATRQRRRGMGTHAVALTLSWLFDELDLVRVEMTTTPDNPVVPVLAQRFGFTLEGLMRSRNLERGQRVDVIWYGLLREEWAALR